MYSYSLFVRNKSVIRVLVINENIIIIFFVSLKSDLGKGSLNQNCVECCLCVVVGLFCMENSRSILFF